MDIDFLLCLQQLRLACGSVFDTFFLQISDLATLLVSYTLLALVYWCIDKRIGAAIAWNIGVGCTLNATLKNACKVERPWIKDERIQPVEAAIAQAGGYSFPSGHTTRVVAGWGALGYAWIKDKENRLSGIACWMLITLVMFSRLYFGVHTPQDVFFSLMLGVILLWGIDHMLRIADAKGGTYDLLFVIAGCLICFLPMLRFGCLPNCGSGMGLIAGWYAERRWIRFSLPESKRGALVRFFLGYVFLALMLLCLPNILGLYMESKYAGFFAQGIGAVFVMAGWPFAFSKMWRDNGLSMNRFLYQWLAVLLVLILLFVGGAYFGDQLEENIAGDGVSQNDVVATGTMGDTTYEIHRDGTYSTPVDIGWSLKATEDGLFYDDGKLDTVDDSTHKMAVIGHRGYAEVTPENTIPSFQAAIDIGADWIETDVQKTKDNVLVLFHDTDMKRITGMQGEVADFTYAELCQMDAGKWFSEAYTGTKIPTLEELFTLIADDDVKVYLELKDIGIQEGFVPAIYDMVQRFGLQDRVVYASFNYEYLKEFKGIDENAPILLNTMRADNAVVNEMPAEYYGINSNSVTKQLVDTVHQSGGKVFIWTVDSPQMMKNLYQMGVDGICTNMTGLAMVAAHPEYEFLASNAIDAIPMPGLYENNLPEEYRDMVWQGYARTPEYMISSAYSLSGAYTSRLFVSDLRGKLLHTIDLGFVAHVGGIAYDSAHELLWCTAAEGDVVALPIAMIKENTYDGTVVSRFNGGLTNASGAKVASFICVDDGFLYVGSYSDGSTGKLVKYDISDPTLPRQIYTAAIPQRIQGATFFTDANGVRSLLLTQGYHMYDGRLLCFNYDESQTEYLIPDRLWHLPEGVEQPLMTAQGLFLQFESAALPYRATARNPGDHLWLVNIE